jgi:glycosyltransferase involved in cell wall biosynthesis
VTSLILGLMPDWTALWTGATLLIGLIWLKRHIDLNRGGREPILDVDEPGPAAADPPSVTVVVAAKDEEANIAACIEGLLRQDYARLHVVIADDRSDDRTGAIIDEFARRDPRLTAVHVRELPAGWFGKNNAMRLGVAESRGDWLCFSDADCQYDSPRLLTAAVRFALRERVDFLSVLPFLEASTFWERVVQPAAGGIMVFWYPPQKVNDPASPRAYANGAFMLMPRRTYEAIGGHDAVRDTLNEDMHMARRVKQRGLRLRVIRGGRAYRVRMYTGFRQIWRGWSRIFYGCFGTFGRLATSVGMLSIFSLSPYLTLALAPLGGDRALWLAASGAFAGAAQISVMWRFYELSNVRGGWSLTYPLGAALCLGMTLNALLKLNRAVTTTWRGTAYRGGAQTAAESGTSS